MRNSWSRRLRRAARVSVAVFTAGNLVLQTTLVAYAQTLAADPGVATPTSMSVTPA